MILRIDNYPCIMYNMMTYPNHNTQEKIMHPETLNQSLYNEYVTGERDYHSDMELREWMYAELYNEDNIDDIYDTEADG